MKGSSIIAATFSTDCAGFEEYRYQPGRTSRAIYAVGDDYFAVGKTRPKDECGQGWEPYGDQFWAEHYKTTLWVSKLSGE